MMQIYLDCNFLFGNLIDLLYTGVASKLRTFHSIGMLY